MRQMLVKGDDAENGSIVEKCEQSGTASESQVCVCAVPIPG